MTGRPAFPAKSEGFHVAPAPTQAPVKRTEKAAEKPVEMRAARPVENRTTVSDPAAAATTPAADVAAENRSADASAAAPAGNAPADSGQPDVEQVQAAAKIEVPASVAAPATPDAVPEAPASIAATTTPVGPAESVVASAETAERPAAEPGDPFAIIPGAPLEPVPGLESGGDEIPYDELMADYSEPAIRAGDLCQGLIVSIDGDNVIVAYGGKTEGVVPLAELQQAGIAEPAAGQDIEVTIESLGGPGDYAVLSYLKAHQSRMWEKIEQSFRQKETLTAKIIERVKGGVTADIGVMAFLPGSQADVRPVPDLDALVGTEIPVQIVKLSRSRGNVVVSRRALLEEELKERRQQTLASLSQDALVTGTVKSVTNYGAFIDLGGIDGLLHVTDISWGRVRNPAEVLHVGEEIPVKVLKFDAQKERVSLSLKHMQPDPWEHIEQRFREGQRATGKVVSVTDYGAFIELEPGLEGLIHVSELSWSKRLKHPSKAFQLGQQVEAVITQMNSAERRISLSLKRLQPDPWVNLSERYPLGQIVEGRVRNLTSYGAFVEIEEGVDGLIHVSDLSWSNKVKHPKDELKKGQVIQAVVLHADEESRRVSLGVKQLEPDVWEKFFSLHLPGDDVTGQITRFAKFGAFVELAPGVEGLCHNTEMSADPSRQRKPALRAGQEYEFRIIKLDEFDKKISLSRRAYELAHSSPASNGTASAQPDEGPGEALHDDEALQTMSEESA
jgi:small subunit ribosomal protein S1